MVSKVTIVAGNSYSSLLPETRGEAVATLGDMDNNAASSVPSLDIDSQSLGLDALVETEGKINSFP